MMMMALSKFSLNPPMLNVMFFIEVRFLSIDTYKVK